MYVRRFAALSFTITLTTTGLLAPFATARAQQPVGTSGAYRTLASFTTDQFNTDPIVSPDGRFILLGSTENLSVYDVATKKTTKLVDGNAWNLAWSPAGDRIAWVRPGEKFGEGFVWSMALDPRTAMPRSAPQRVTVGQSVIPSISPDGKLLAFSSPASEEPGSLSGRRPQRLVVAPVTGGPEQVLARFDGGFEEIHWSANGRSMFVRGAVSGTKETSITKISLDGSAPVAIRPAEEEWLAGMTRDRQHLVLVPARNPIALGHRAIVIDTAGRELGGAQLPIGTVNQYGGVLRNEALIWVNVKYRRRLERQSLTTEATTRLAVSGESNDSPVWSPDGKSVAFVVRERGQQLLAVMNTDGTNRRVFPDFNVRADSWWARWSPDSRYLGYISADGHQLRLYDQGSRTTKSLVADTSVRIGQWIWRADSKSISTVATRRPSPLQMSIEEVSILGERKTFPGSDTLPKIGMAGFQFIDASTVYVRGDSASFRVPLGGRTARRIATVAAGTRVNNLAISPDGKWAGGPLIDVKRPQSNQVELVQLETGERRVVDLMFRFTSSFKAVFSNDSRELLVVGERLGDAAGKRLYAVPVNGDSPRMLATLGPSQMNSAFALSPDGASVLVSKQESITIDLLLVDIRSILNRSTSVGLKR